MPDSNTKACTKLCMLIWKVREESHLAQLIEVLHRILFDLNISYT